MYTIPIYQADAFTGQLFSGNPAAVCLLNQWLPDSLMQQIGMENNLAETAFVVKQGDKYHIRWFTPQVEVDLCGHATLAAAHVLYNYTSHQDTEIEFWSPRSGPLHVRREDKLIILNFPTDDFHEVALTPQLLSGFDRKPRLAFRGKTDYMLVFDSEDDITALQPDLSRIATLGGRGVIVTAPGKQVHFVSRFFAPQSGIDEDPVTGSAHTTLTPYWSAVLGENTLTAIQLSARRGYLRCKNLGDRTEISGEAATYLKGEIFIP